MRISLLLLGLLIAGWLSPSATAQNQRGDIVFFNKIHSFEVDSLAALLDSVSGFPAIVFALEYDIDVYEVGYKTLDYTDDSLTTATGLVAIPTNYACDLSLYTFGHGLSLKDREVASSFNNIYSYIAMGGASNGFILMAPDYIHMGYNASPGFQAFMHAKTEAAATVDLIRATKTFCQNNSIGMNEQLFLSGYSQGGHSSMATAREIQLNHANEFTVTAVGSGGGTFDLSGIAADSLASQTRTTVEPQAFCLIARSYLEVYKDTLAAWGFNFDFDDFFQAPYDSILNIMLDRSTSLYNGSLLLSIPNMMLEDTFRLDFLNNPNSVMRQLLAKNDLYDWAPQMPIRMYHGTADIENPYDNVIFTQEQFELNGSTTTEVVNVGDIGHQDAAVPMILQSKSWFKSLRETCPVSIPENDIADQVQVYPHPISDHLRLDLSVIDGTEALYIFSLEGKEVYRQSVEGHDQIMITMPSTMVSGTYLLVIEGESIFTQPIIVQ